MNNTDESFGIRYYKDHNGILTFGVRGIGRTYKKFYSWLTDKKYKTVDEDWPWHYIQFLNRKDVDEMYSLFGQYIYSY